MRANEARRPCYQNALGHLAKVWGKVCTFAVCRSAPISPVGSSDCEHMASEPGCRPGGAELSSPAAARRVVIASPSATPLPANPTKPRYTLPRAARLRGNAAFRYLWKFGRLYREGGLVLRAVFFPIALSQPAVKAAFLVRKKLFRRSVKRQRIRRLLREGHRHLRPDWEAVLKGAEAWLLWSWEGPTSPSLRALSSAMQRLFDKAYQAWQKSLSF